MKIKGFLILTALFLSLQIFPQTNNSGDLFKKLVEMEYKNLKILYTDCLTHPCYGDSLFYKTWLDSLENEMNNSLLNASECFNKALLINGFELSSYEVGFSLGRVELLKGNIKKGIEILKKYLEDADKDLNNDDSMWGLTEEGLKEIKIKIEYAKDLIKKYK